MGETLTREQIDDIERDTLDREHHEDSKTIEALCAMARASLDLAEQLSAARRELGAVRAAVQAYLVAEYEYERWPSRDTQTAKANALDTLRAALEDKGNV